MNFSAEYQLTFEEFKEIYLHVQQHYRHRQIRGKIVPRWIVTTVLVVVLVGFGFFITHDGKHSIEFDDIVKGSFPLLVFLGLRGLVALLQRSTSQQTIQRAWDNSSALHQTTTIQVTSDGINTLQTTAQHQYGWEHFVSFDETPTMFLLFTTDYAGVEIPKRVFDDEKIEDEVRTLFKRNIGGMTHAFPVLSISASEAEKAQNESL